MGCGCSKGKTPSGGRAARSSGPVSARLGASSTTARPFTRLRYVAISPDGQETYYTALAEAQSAVRSGGAGWRIESRRG